MTTLNKMLKDIIILGLKHGITFIHPPPTYCTLLKSVHINYEVHCFLVDEMNKISQMKFDKGFYRDSNYYIGYHLEESEIRLVDYVYGN